MPGGSPSGSTTSSSASASPGTRATAARRAQGVRGGSRPDAAASPPAQPGTLKVGANPWGDVYRNGRKLGRAPGAWSLPPGPHTIEVIFPVAGREQKREFNIHIQSGEVTSLGIVDFTGDFPGP